jgi:hypothetical protein
MHRRKGLVVALIAMLAVGAFGLLGSAGEGRASARTIDPFTLTAAPNPANFGKKVVFTIDFVNASNQTIAHAAFHGVANGVVAYLPDFSTTSTGTCAVDPTNALAVNCDYGNLESGAHVTTTFTYSLPASGASAGFDATNGLIINEGGGGGGCTPGQQCDFSPDPPTVSVPLQAATENQTSDVLKPVGGDRVITTGLPTAATAAAAKASRSAKPGPVTFTNPTGMTLNIPSTGLPIPASILEGLDNTGACGGGVTQPVTSATEMTAPGDFSATPIVGAFSVLAKSLPNGVQGSGLKFCHNDAPVALCQPPPAPIPANGCQDGAATKSKNPDGDFIWSIAFKLPSNGRGVGGYP